MKVKAILYSIIKLVTINCIHIKLQELANIIIYLKVNPTQSYSFITIELNRNVDRSLVNCSKIFSRILGDLASVIWFTVLL